MFFLVAVKPATQQTAPRVPKPGGVSELFTGDLEKDKKIKNIHKVNKRTRRNDFSFVFIRNYKKSKR